GPGSPCGTCPPSTRAFPMNLPAASLRRILATLVLLALAPIARPGDAAETPDGRRLYVAVPGIRNYLEYGGHGLLVFDIDHGHKFVKRIPTAGLDAQGKPDNVKGICASADTKRVHISTTKTLTSLDLVGEKVIWERPY